MFAHVPGPQGRRAGDARRRLRAAQERDPRRRPGAVHREPRALQHDRASCRTGEDDSRCRSAAPTSSARARDLTLVAHSLHRAPRADGRRPAGDRGHRGRGRSTCARCARSTPRPSSSRSRRPAARVVAEEGWSTYGVGAEVAARIQRACFDDLDAPGRARRRRRGADAVRQAARAGRAADGEDKIEAAARALLARVRPPWKGSLMAVEIVMPRLSDTMERGTVARWLKKEGDTVAEGDVAGRDRDRQGDDGARDLRRRRAAARSSSATASRPTLGAPIALVGEAGEEVPRRLGGDREPSRRGAPAPTSRAAGRERAARAEAEPSRPSTRAPKPSAARRERAGRRGAAERAR